MKTEMTNRQRRDAGMAICYKLPECSGSLGSIYRILLSI